MARDAAKRAASQARYADKRRAAAADNQARGIPRALAWGHRTKTVPHTLPELRRLAAQRRQPLEAVARVSALEVAVKPTRGTVLIPTDGATTIKSPHAGPALRALRYAARNGLDVVVHVAWADGGKGAIVYAPSSAGDGTTPAADLLNILAATTRSGRLTARNFFEALEVDQGLRHAGTVGEVGTVYVRVIDP